MKVLGLQLDIAWENPPANFTTVRRLLAAAAPAPGTLVALPEMFATGFSMNAAAIADPPDGPACQFLSTTARAFGITLLAGLATLGPDGRPRNQALVFSPEGHLVASYSKIKLFTPGGEPSHYTPGTVPVAFTLADWTIAPLICYDLRFPELFRQTAARQRPELFVVVANWPEKRLHHWVRLLQARAIENQAFVLAVNRTGRDPYYAYAGRSLVVDPQGEILADAGSAEGWVAAELDLETLRQYRRGLPFLDDLDRL